jgi:glycosyltransferase involved in cell wall biosynthesis
MDSIQKTSQLISVVIPVFNEADSLAELLNHLMSVAETNRYQMEVFIVDDGSDDSTWEVICALASQNSCIHGVRLRRNFGKTSALAAGFKAASGEIVFQMDGDLQDDPAEIPNLLRVLNEGADVVNGWKRQRKDPWHKILSSRIFNWMVGCVSGLKLHDHNCGLKCFREEALKQIPLYGERHRFIPILAHAKGYRVAELEVRHHPRRHGKSKYGAQRFVKGLLDLLTMTFLTGFTQTPFHLLGGIGLLAFIFGASGLGYLAICWSLAQQGVEGFGPVGQHSLLICSAAALVLGVQMLGMGLLAELMISINFRDQPQYSIAETTGAKAVTETK